jgi:alkyl hydroperoxide reductase subunit AhpC
MPAYQADIARFAALDAQVVGISMDSIFSHIAWQEKEIGKLDYPLLSDFYPHGDVTRKYQILREGPPLPGISDRAIYIVDKQGKIAWFKQYELGEQPPNEEVLAVLKKISG